MRDSINVAFLAGFATFGLLVVAGLLISLAPMIVALGAVGGTLVGIIVFVIDIRTTPSE